jgi:hypothetical protein
MSTSSQNNLPPTPESKDQNTGPDGAKATVLTHSAPIPHDAISVMGPDLTKVKDVKGLMESFARIGFQATSLARAIEIVQSMVRVMASVFSILNKPRIEKVETIRRVASSWRGDRTRNERW